MKSFRKPDPAGSFKSKRVEVKNHSGTDMPNVRCPHCSEQLQYTDGVAECLCGDP